jgi:hypothetical protein
MPLSQIDQPFPHGQPSVRLRELTGADERLVRDTTTATAVRLLGRLMDPPPDTAWGAASLTASERDRLLAAVYRQTFGERVSSTTHCADCSSLVDLSFALDDLLGAVESAALPEAVELFPDGSFRTAAGVRFRLPTGEDELAMLGLPPEAAERALFARCLLEAPPGVDARAAVEEAIAEVAPVLDLVVYAHCRDCSARQAVRFDMQFYLLQALAQERTQLMYDVHRMAFTYGWSLDEILGLCRSDRRQLAAWIESELPHRQRAQ